MHSERLKDKMPKAPSKIFVGSMSDCKYWSHEQWDKILEVCCEYQQHTFMFLTKSESAYNGRSFPSNTMQGLTLTLNEPSARWDYEAVSYCRKPFLSIEPLMGKLTFKPRNVDLVIVGAMTGAGALKPRPEWIQSVKDNVPVNKIYWKSNIKKYL
jgi:protein gp37